MHSLLTNDPGRMCQIVGVGLLIIFIAVQIVLNEIKNNK